MTPDERKGAGERLRLFLRAEDRDTPVSRAELAGYLFAALQQIEGDEGLMRTAMEALDECAQKIHWLDFLEGARAALRARLGPAPEVKP